MAEYMNVSDNDNDIPEIEVDMIVRIKPYIIKRCGPCDY